MGVMMRLRKNTGVILWILVIAFGVIWTLQDSNVFNVVGQPTQNIAVVNGAPVPYEQYQRALQQQRQQFQQRMGEVSPAMEDMIRQRTFDQLVSQQLVEQEMQRLGITVTDQEVLDMVYGENPHPIIRQQFADSTGAINRQMIRNLAQNPQMAERWKQLEEFLRRQRRQQKLQTLLTSTVLVSKQDVASFYERQNTTVDTRYVSVRYATVPDDSVTVTTQDLRDYYEANKEDFKQPKTYKLSYVTRSKKATAADSTAIAEDLRGYRDEFAAAANDSAFVAENASVRSFSSAYLTPTNMQGPIADAIFADGDAQPGEIVGPVFANERGHLVKVIDARPSDETFVHARHILIPTDGQTGGMEALGLMQRLRDSLQTGASFAELAREYSEDPGSASQGGDLGWFGRGRMVAAFNDAAFDAAPGEVVGPVKTQFGYHLIKVEARAEQAVQIADLAFSLNPSMATLNDIEADLDDLAYYAEQNGNFAAEAKRQNLDVQTVQIEADQNAVPGLGRSYELTNFVQGVQEGAISPVLEFQNQFAVVKVMGVQPEGYRAFADVKAQVRSQVELQKKRDVAVAMMRRALAATGSLDGVAEALGTRVRTKQDVTFNTTTVAGIGRDAAFAGAAMALQPGEMSNVIGGDNAAFVVQCTGRNEPAPLTAEKREELEQQLLQRQQQQVVQQWIASLRDAAEIQDNRSEILR
ncbi:peptidylprolyl isomerase [Salisaeta longa]|uniref:peptidylprolyl isomerase n=1 Tax=Salisaeta longa TaxID=503170 RepID=UPI0003B34644|nr:peptidyl-prolyl cis-trans isomerase [Salisaeta longa]